MGVLFCVCYLLLSSSGFSDLLLLFTACFVVVAAAVALCLFCFCWYFIFFYIICTDTLMCFCECYFICIVFDTCRRALRWERERERERERVKKQTHICRFRSVQTFAFNSTV